MGSIKSVGVIGSGIMGSGLAEVTARAGFDVVVRSRTQARADAVLAGIDTGLSKQVSRERISESDRDSILARISVTDDLHKVGDCDLVIESVVEDMDVKRDLFSRLDEIVRSDAILATNTSTLAVVELAMATKHPERVCGIHFFNPAPMMKLVEVIAPLTASDATIEAALGFARDCGKDAVQVQDRAGFIVNALLFPYLNNAIRMWEQGTASMDDIDTAMQGGCNFPMGPFALLDLVGLDTSLAILDALYEEFRDPNFAAAPALRRMVSAGHLGRKTKHGFRTY
jgi:3-hydroxybutyryl-CoA dehydrogenase